MLLINVDASKGKYCEDAGAENQEYSLRDYIWWKQQVGNTDFWTWLI